MAFSGRTAVTRYFAEGCGEGVDAGAGVACGAAGAGAADPAVVGAAGAAAAACCGWAAGLIQQA